MKAFYLVCCVIGVVLPYSQFIPWLLEPGHGVVQLLTEAIGSKISAFAWADVLVSAVVLLTFVDTEAKRIGMNHRWIPWVGTLTVGVSLGLPLFLYLRELQLEKLENPKTR